MSAPERRVLVTGVAAVSPLGLDAEETWQGLVEGRSGIGPITRFDASDFPCRIAGEVRGFDPERFLDRRDVKKTDRFTQFAVACARMLFENARLEEGSFDPERAGVVIGSGIGGLELLERQHRILLERGPRRLSPFLIPGMIINLAAGMVSILFGLKGPNSATVTACASGNHAIGDAFRYIRHGDADLMIAGGTEAVISPLAVGGFCAMRALSTRNEEPSRASRPFDAGRDGFVMGEGCGLLLLESEEHARRRGAEPLAELAGFGMSGDAYHISAPPPDGMGMVRVMEAALRDAGIRPEEIDYINAHGTSTPVGDAIEARAVRRVFGSHADRLLVSSTKSMTGHLLGAAGGLEAVITVLAVARDTAPPTANLEELDPEIARPLAEGGEIGLAADRFVPGRGRKAEIRAALSNSFGFGGTNATLVFRKA
ncbi:MAG: beta-ketoacyl-[acyl-carrier-protein] synthase II [Acidobacteria bacterium]|nr:MAG: beta-ketoacyl-[acyl-carrier-protein] synthase II [Acidobacteriota bacterium]